MIDLNTLIPATSSLQLIDAVNINERGEILVVELPSGVQPGGGNGRLALLVPCAGDEETCGDDAEAASAATQNNLAPISPITSAQGRAVPSGIAAWRERLASGLTFPASESRHGISYCV